MNDFADITGSWDYRELPSNIHLGEGVWLERKHSFARFRSAQSPGLILGDRVRVYTWTTFNVDPSGRIEVGDDSVLVGPVFMCADQISIGKNVVISYHVTIADSDFHPLDPVERRRDAIANAPHGNREQRPVVTSSPVDIGDDVEVGIGAFILKGAVIGRGARIGAGAVVTGHVPAGGVASGNPAVVEIPG